MQISLPPFLKQLQLEMNIKGNASGMALTGKIPWIPELSFSIISDSQHLLSPLIGTFMHISSFYSKALCYGYYPNFIAQGDEGIHPKFFRH